jgi:hypothetical protein
MRFTARIMTALAVITTITTVSACGSDLTIPSDSGTGSSDERSAATVVDSALGAGRGGSRIEVKLFPGELVAREVHLEADDDEEKIVSNVTAIDPEQGTISLELGGLTVSYGTGTRFRTETESHESRGVWEASVQSELAAGRRPLIEARRSPSGSPQAPGDPTFVAADLRLEGDGDEPEIEIRVDEDNLESVSGNSLAVLRVLGLPIEINGRTQLGEDDGADGNDDDRPAGVSVEFEMRVAAVDASAGTLTLASGTVVLVTAATSISAEGDLLTLESTAGAVAAGRPVRAEGRGTVESAGPPTVILATSLKVELDD